MPVICLLGHLILFQRSLGICLFLIVTNLSSGFLTLSSIISSLLSSPSSPVFYFRYYSFSVLESSSFFFFYSFHFSSDSLHLLLLIMAIVSFKCLNLQLLLKFGVWFWVLFVCLFLLISTSGLSQSVFVGCLCS